MKGVAIILGSIVFALVLMIGATAIEERVRWGFWPWQYTPEKMRRVLDNGPPVQARGKQ